MNKYFLFILLGLLFVSCSNQQQPTWQLVYQNDYTGKTKSGSKNELISALKRGSPIRVSWGEKLEDGTTCVEFAEPVFTTLINDSDVVVQFPLSMIQTNYINAEKSFLKTDPPIGWRALMSTDGHYHQFHYDLKTGDVKRIMYSRTNMSWYALIPVEDNREVPVLAEENTFKLDSLIKR